MLKSEIQKVDHALALAIKGFWIFPVKPNSKKPAIDQWNKRATRDETQIRHWWRQWPEANIGIFTERYDKHKALIVLDIDVKNGKDGFQTMRELEIKRGLLPTEYLVRTPSGGLHVYLIAEKPAASGVDVLGSGIDIRSRGGYVLGPGSTINGKKYKIER